jgi:choline dehydrogenase
VFDVVVVGAGSAGCALAARLALRTEQLVLLLEAGPGDFADPTVGSLAATAPGDPRNWAHPVELAPGLPATVPRGRGVGGSGAINGAVWTYVTPEDAKGWGIPGWSYPMLRYWYTIAEREPIFATEGPVPVQVPSGPLLHPTAERFLTAAAALGFAEEPYKNAGAPPGAGLVPSNSRDGRRIDPARAYLPKPLPACAQHVVSEPDGAEPGPQRVWYPGPQWVIEPRAPVVRANSPVRRVLVQHGQSFGVELANGERIPAEQVVLCAGAVGTPRILMRSGLGPAETLRSAGIAVQADLPDVGREWSDHPAVFLPFRAEDPPPDPHAPTAQAALNWDAGADPAGDVEVLLFTRPFVEGGDLHLMCSLQQPDSRGTLDLEQISYGYLRTEHDRRRLRHALRTAADMLRAGLGARTEPDGAVLGNDRALDEWIAAHLTTAVHLCGSAAMGRVVDAELRVHGVNGLRVADTSVLPMVPRRGPAATAVAIGEKAAALLSGITPPA